MAGEHERPEPHGFWSGTFSFGLVSVPVVLYAATRSRHTSLRMLGSEGQLLRRRYFCSADGKLLDRDELVRGYPWEPESFIVVSDEELEALQPDKSRDIDLRRFVPLDEIDRSLLERPYVLAPSGKSTKAYHLLAETMEASGRAGIATFVMRGRENLIAVFARDGLLRGATLRFADELRTPEDIGLPAVNSPPAKRVEALRRALRALDRDSLNEARLMDQDQANLRELAEREREAGVDLVKVEEPQDEVSDEDAEADNVVDIMALLKQRMGSGPERSSAGSRSRGKEARASNERSRSKPKREEQLGDVSRDELYERAKDLEISGRSKMTKEQLASAIRRRIA